MRTKRTSLPKSATVILSGVADTLLATYSPEELFIRTIATLEADKGLLVKDAYFDGGDILACRAGRFRFDLEDGRTFELCKDHVLVIYPGNTVTISSLEKDGKLNFIILNGLKVSTFFDQYGLYDGLLLPAETQEQTFAFAQKLAERNKADPAAISLISDMLNSFAQQWRKVADPLFMDAIRVLNRNFRKGIVRLDPVLNELSVSRTRLYAAFARQGVDNPGAMIRRAQLRESLWLMNNTLLSIKEIANAVGINSPVYFTNFIKRLTGRTPTALRHAGDGTKSAAICRRN